MKEDSRYLTNYHQVNRTAKAKKNMCYGIFNENEKYIERIIISYTGSKFDLFSEILIRDVDDIDLSNLIFLPNKILAYLGMGFYVFFFFYLNRIYEMIMLSVFLFHAIIFISY